MEESMNKRLDPETANSPVFRRKVYQERWRETLDGFKYLAVAFLSGIGLAVLANDLFGFDEWFYNRALERESRFWGKKHSV